jgi:phosphoglycolate phosphatase
MRIAPFFGALLVATSLAAGAGAQPRGGNFNNNTPRIGSGSSSGSLGRSNAYGSTSFNRQQPNALGRQPMRLLPGPQQARGYLQAPWGTPRGATAATVTTRRGVDVYSVRDRSGRVQRFAFNRPTAVAPLRAHTDRGVVPVSVVGFDIDGTLVDTRETIAEGIRGGLQSLGLPNNESWVLDQTRGRPYSEVAHAAVEQFRPQLEAREGRPLTETRINELRDRFISTARQVTETAERSGRARAYPGAQAILADLRARGVRVIAVTSRPTDSAMSLLRQNGLDRHVQVVVGRQENSANGRPEVLVNGRVLQGRIMDAKPAPSSLLFALRLLGGGAHPSETVYVGDMHTDLRTADGAGVTPIAITHGMDTRETLSAERPAAMVNDVAGLRSTLGLDAREPASTTPTTGIVSPLGR